MTKYLRRTMSNEWLEGTLCILCMILMFLVGYHVGYRVRGLNEEASKENHDHISE